MNQLEYCKDCNKVLQDEYPHHRCNLCKHCPIRHVTQDHKCYIYGLVGVSSHSWHNCPDRCTLCRLSHKTKDHPVLKTIDQVNDCPSLPESTDSNKQAIPQICQLVRQYGAEIQYADGDSIMFSFPDLTLQDTLVKRDKLQTLINDRFENYNHVG